MRRSKFLLPWRFAVVSVALVLTCVHAAGVSFQFSANVERPFLVGNKVLAPGLYLFTPRKLEPNCSLSLRVVTENGLSEKELGDVGCEISSVALTEQHEASVTQKIEPKRGVLLVVFSTPNYKTNKYLTITATLELAR